MLHGFLNVDKPAGLTSHDVVARLRRVAGQKRIGHGGTLDPAATGVLPIALGEATRLVEYLVEGRKRYTAVVELGVVTTTDDAEGEIVASSAVPHLTLADLLSALDLFVGEIDQVPPMYSAVQVDGKRLYELARAGVTLERAPRRIAIDRIEINTWQAPMLELDITCGKGTYVRALARDLGERLGCGAHLRSLRRTAVGPLRVETAVPLAELLSDPAALPSYLLAPDSAVAHLPHVRLDAEAERGVRNGIAIDLPVGPASTLCALDAAGRLVALLRYAGGAWRPFKVFGWQ